MINAPESPGGENTLSASRPVNNKHVKGNAAGASKNDCVDVGHIELDIVNTSVPAREGEETWVEYLLEQSGDYDYPLRPVSVALRSLLDSSGGVREDARKFGDVLGSRNFVYVCELKLATEWRRKRLGSVAMEVLHRMLPVHLGHGDAAMLLQPAVLAGGIPKDLAGEYQKMLFRFYGSLGTRSGLR
ncbi:hypothetical protein LTR35_012439 [Friedmanniomyces endolithicus]|uniref:Uncharacterized protein n=1 Tax=Friedmanniomyces endolithicus TaxID=329885 RepID=A0AAN6J5Q3_9PEZI|nr:hypothetical protein LTR35_012439 [Friedmanniomyces endolithicus]KAK0294591.1 hypothetical protein LTS00_006792 [Friedmanniomyces endolithicus]KAK0318190.1 hypothetical protein LTR82_010889 [Friedmanniomyces endolithicus]KAK1009802.1 hypothetical protein LTR54_005598 [Friedmanniomyces endolithicus]